MATDASARLRAAPACLLAAAAACRTFGVAEPPPLPPELGARVPAAAELGAAGRHLAAGIRHLDAGEIERAGRHFNQGLAASPEHPHLNFLNAYVYELLGAAGDRTKEELAEVGYLLTLRFDPSHWLAAYRLGRLHYKARRYRAAQNELARALLAEPRSPDAAYALAAASYAAKDPRTAQAALRFLSAGAAAEPRVLRARALITAALGRRREAEVLVAAYRAGGPPAWQADRAERRVAAWGELHAETATAAASTAGAPAAEAPQAPKAPPPPEPPPNMVVLDAVIVSQERSHTARNGINLLSALSIQFAGNILDASRNVTKDLSTGAFTTFQETSASSLTISVPAIAYSLNIANAGDSTSEIVARPSVLAHYGQESEVFVGTEITYTANGTLGGGASYNKEVGLTLHARPEPTADGKLRLAIRTEFSSFLPTSPPGSFQQAVATVKSRSNVTAEMRVGQTVAIAAGTTTRESSISDGVPILRDLPVIQYLFSSRSRFTQSASLIVLITPRLPSGAAPARELSREAAGDALDALAERYEPWFRPTPNLAAVLSRLSDGDLAREFRSGDIEPGPLSEPSRARRVIRDLLELIYF